MKNAFILAILMALPLSAQEGRRPDPRRARPEVDAAIEKGMEVLKRRVADLDAGTDPGDRVHELVLWTFVHGGLPESDPTFRALFRGMMEDPLERTYRVSLQAMILEEVHRVKYQRRIARCAQFLVDNQCKNGQWSYGKPTVFVEDVPTIVRKKSVATRGSKLKRFRRSPPSGRRPKPPVRNRMAVAKRREGPESGDNSNSQYAALGLRACHDAGIILPKPVIGRAMRWWRECQQRGSAGRGGYPGAGWCYGMHSEHQPYGSMTAGGLGSLAIYDYILGMKWKKDKNVKAGLQWLARNFSVTGNPGPYEHGDFAENSQHQFYYYLYGLERAGMLYGTEKFGGHEWYPEGARVLLERQEKNGEWDGVVNTCFAILFLRRATRSLDVATRDTLRTQR